MILSIPNCAWAEEKADWMAVAGKDSLVIEATLVPDKVDVSFDGPPLEAGVSVTVPYRRGYRLENWVALQVPEGFTIANTLGLLFVDYRERQTLRGRRLDTKSELPPRLASAEKNARVILILNNYDESFSKVPFQGKVLGKGGAPLWCDAKNLRVL